MRNAQQTGSKGELEKIMPDMWARIDSTPKVVSVHPAPKPRCRHPHINFMHRYRKLAAMYRRLFAVQRLGLR